MIRLKPSLAWVCLALIVAMLAIRPAGESLVPAAVNDWAVISMAIWVQATPFLLLGVVVAGVITIYGFGGNFSMAALRIPLDRSSCRRWCGRNAPHMRVCGGADGEVAGPQRSSTVSGTVVHGCGSGGEPHRHRLHAGRLHRARRDGSGEVRRGHRHGGAHRPGVGEAGRGVGGPLDPLNAQPAANAEEAPKIGAVASAVSIGAFIAREFVGASALLALGASVVGAFKTLVPQDWVDAVGSNPVAGVAAMVALALILFAVLGVGRFRRRVDDIVLPGGSTGVYDRRPGHRHQARPVAGRNIGAGIPRPLCPDCARWSR